MSRGPRTIAIGDIHGCATALRALLDGLRLEAADTVVMLGDAIDRGPDSRGVLEQLITLGRTCRLVCIMGNHEQMMLDAVDGEIAVQEWLIHGGAETLDSYGHGAGVNALSVEHLKFVETWGDLHETDSHFFAHGNYLADKPLARQPWRELRWQSLKWHTPAVHVSGKTAVVGHTSHKRGEIINLGHIVCIDTYCCGGCWLTAFDATTGRVYQSNEAAEFRTGELPPVRSLASMRL